MLRVVVPHWPQISETQSIMMAAAETVTLFEAIKVWRIGTAVAIIKAALQSNRADELSESESNGVVLFKGFSRFYIKRF
ncbi:MAG: hypothetical protein KC433_16270 [Anaerolineales bacterium]|nr:hypothetical protein [Anaerolineales bacterium]